MACLIYQINLTVESSADEITIREKVEEALNMGCSHLESELPHQSVYYKIKDVMDIS